eukprot:c3486_g1_i1.p1 GENE.c3486_g1_i1~~c3486_g1_i1.p1  ORF type:complete len:457 (+),score=58.44 c3486_g1_i1:48-1418(+)
MDPRGTQPTNPPPSAPQTPHRDRQIQSCTPIKSEHLLSPAPASRRRGTEDELLMTPERTKASAFGIDLSPLPDSKNARNGRFGNSPSPVRNTNRRGFDFCASPNPGNDPLPHTDGDQIWPPRGIVFDEENGNEDQTGAQKVEDTDASFMPEGGVTEGAKKCNCKRSQCLKLYCECFANQRLCAGCNCSDCRNTEEHLSKVIQVRKSRMTSNPTVFNSKAKAKTQHKGCHCKKGCNKKYCECFSAGLSCSNTCRCVSCLNSRDQSPQNEEPQEYSVGVMDEHYEHEHQEYIPRQSYEQTQEIALLPNTTRTINFFMARSQERTNGDTPTKVENQVESAHLSFDTPPRDVQPRAKISSGIMRPRNRLGKGKTKTAESIPESEEVIHQSPVNQGGGPPGKDFVVSSPSTSFSKRLRTIEPPETNSTRSYGFLVVNSVNEVRPNEWPSWITAIGKRGLGE